MSGLTRDILKWLQSLDLTTQIRNPKWDFSNGYLVAEIFSWYYPQEILMHSFYNGESLAQKNKNWYLLKNFILRNSFDIKMEDVDGTIHCREGAAVQLVESMYEILTNKRVKKILPEIETDYTDFAYQQRLPMHARPTASKAVKNNLRLTEILADQNIITSTAKPDWFAQRTILKAQKIINDHIDHRRQERIEDPKRFGIKPSLGDRCVRRADLSQKLFSEPSHLTVTSDLQSELETESMKEGTITREPSIQFKEIDVKQMDKSTFYQLPVQSY
ncbi:spermatogenesis-associated protein 4-like isoform X1 [Biomphalaria pfeifferi]|uniref:Spermatogenesis-associated protein 4 n=1 Tax=Biomphalaria pfeifferi TaxID=112525 RepID=A0AAD8AUQ0_BIOPF|nr:spermatogenesis-associated protein 4-like isoform X1 [Biomphalaria pfeifferi]